MVRRSVVMSCAVVCDVVKWCGTYHPVRIFVTRWFVMS